MTLNTRLDLLSTNDLKWSSPLEELFTNKVPKSVSSLKMAGYHTLEDLLWIIPLEHAIIPPLSSFASFTLGEIFQGVGRILSRQSRPNFRAKGKGRAMLQNITVQVKDHFSDQVIELKWFNSYPSQIHKLRKIHQVVFWGIAKEFNGKQQIVNPELRPASDEDLTLETQGDQLAPNYKIRYPTVNAVNSTSIKKMIAKIPSELWTHLCEHLPAHILKKNQLLPLDCAFNTIHGRFPLKKDSLEAAKNRLIYEEFFQEQVKLAGRKKHICEGKGVTFRLPTKLIEDSKNLFPYPLTSDQKSAIDRIAEEMSSGHAMMKLIQGDVGCGKTSVAIAAIYLTFRAGYQSAFMCPTESLSQQHFRTIREIFAGKGIIAALLLGNTPPKEKKKIREQLAAGDIDLLVGTHSLIQQDVDIPSLGLSIIDEQHKFGVNQRIQLTEKNAGGHCLIMTATPIPRSLGLTQYGDLSLCVIKTMPAGRKGTKTRIVNPDSIHHFFNFIQTRLDMGEQAYIVVPAIKESETLDIMNLEKVHQKFTKLFPKHTVKSLHGQMKPEEKFTAFDDFKEQRIDLLIATSVIEVGINVVNATIMAVLSPERFGLSSLHQLRGRVGRGEKAGFFFLVNDKAGFSTALKRMQILEKTNDGFEISEEDLKIRGRGDLFGTDQSGAGGNRRLACIVKHQDRLLAARHDVTELVAQQDPKILNLIEQCKQDGLVAKTI